MRLLGNSRNTPSSHVHCSPKNFAAYSKYTKWYKRQTDTEGGRGGGEREGGGGGGGAHHCRQGGWREDQTKERQTSRRDSDAVTNKQTNKQSRSLDLQKPLLFYVSTTRLSPWQTPWQPLTGEVLEWREEE